MKRFTLVVFLLLLLTSLPARAQGHSVTLAFTASSTVGVTGYNMYRAPCTGTITANVCSAAGIATKLSVTPFNALSYTDTAVVAGGSYDYYATAVCPTTICTTAESVPSNHWAVNVPKDVSQPPGNLTAPTVTRNSSGANTTISARWTDAPSLPTTYRLVDSFGSLLTSGTVSNPQGSYSVSWAGKVKPGTLLTFTVCDSTSGCKAARI